MSELRECLMWNGRENVSPLPSLAALTDEQRRAVRWAFTMWAQVASEEKYEPISSWRGFQPEVGHSALLERLLGGEAPFVERPPRAFSYPDYKAMGNDETRVSS